MTRELAESLVDCVFDQIDNNGEWMYSRENSILAVQDLLDKADQDKDAAGHRLINNINEQFIKGRLDNNG